LGPATAGAGDAHLVEVVPLAVLVLGLEGHVVPLLVLVLQTGDHAGGEELLLPGRHAVVTEWITHCFASSLARRSSALFSTSRSPSGVSQSDSSLCTRSASWSNRGLTPGNPFTVLAIRESPPALP